MPEDYLKYFEGKKILVTGGRGYLGSNLINVLKDVGCKIIRVDRIETVSVSEKSKAEIKNISGDIRIGEFWEGLLYGTDIIFHFAAQTSVYKADENPVEDFQINVLPMLKLLETCRRRNYKPTIIFSGTATEIGIPIRRPVDETHPDKPVTIYDLHKLIAENYLKFYIQQEVVKGAVLRLANVYGPGPASSSADRGILNLMIKKALHGENLTLYGSGENLRDYIFVEDVVRAFLTAAVNINEVNGNHFVICCGKGFSLMDAFSLVTERVKIKTGTNVQVVSVPPPDSQTPINSRNFVGDSSKFYQLTNWQPKYSLAEGIDRTIGFFQTASLND